MKLSKNIKELRRELNLTQQNLADKLGVRQSNISDWENDISRPEYENLIKLAEIFGVTVGYLLGVED